MGTKQLVARLFLCGEIVLLIVFYWWGLQDRVYYRQLCHDNECLEKERLIILAEIVGLQKQVVLWQRSPFFKEKIAREKLQMARKNDHIYYVE